MKKLSTKAVKQFTTTSLQKLRKASNDKQCKATNTFINTLSFVAFSR